jgi:hypothetical protein
MDLRFAKFVRWGTVPVVLTVMATVLTAQRGGNPLTGAGSVESSVMEGTGARALTPFEQFTDKLKLDERTQLAPVREAFIAAQQEAGPIGVEILQLRLKLLRIDLGESQEDRKSVLDAYAAAAVRMSAIETRTFAKVYAMLKPNQQSNAAQAFALLTGFFQAPAGTGSGRGRGGRQ